MKELFYQTGRSLTHKLPPIKHQSVKLLPKLSNIHIVMRDLNKSFPDFTKLLTIMIFNFPIDTESNLEEGKESI